MRACWCAPLRISWSAGVSSKSIIACPYRREAKTVELNADRAFQHRYRARVAIPHLDRVIAQVAVASQHLHALIGDPHRLLAVVCVCELRLLGGVAALLENRGRLPGHPSHRVSFDAHVGQSKCYDLFLRERRAVHHALLEIGNDEFHYPATDASHDRRERGAPRIEDALNIGSDGLAEPRTCTQLDIFETDGPGLQRAESDAGCLLADANAFAVAIDDKCVECVLASRDHEEVAALCG